LIISLVSNVGVLAFFKYYNFLNENLTALLGQVGSENPIPFLNILLPIGLSFHTFQAMSYTIEVYRGKQKAERHFGIYALYVMFYPQLVAGPIERPQNMLPQFYEKHSFDYRNAVEGLRLILWGIFKKVVIADRLALYVGEVYAHPSGYHGAPVVLASYFFAIQIYCDFSGYSDIAIGTARVMGFRLMQNFNLPYIATSIREFWSRWHISLSTWFRDYLYVPLGGNRVTQPRWFMNLLIVFIISGLWHGAKWTFVIWGGLHGTYLVMEIVLGKVTWIKKFTQTWVGKAVSWFVTFHLVVLGWIFFRAGCTTDALQLIRGIFRRGFFDNISLGETKYLVHIVLGLLFIALLVAAELAMRRRTFEQLWNGFSGSLRWGLYIFLVLVVMWFGVFTSDEFIYFQF
jgi:D-alanyl-lipoteichoic acid acyltransferase DltB (MBOAT superfamily)